MENKKQFGSRIFKDDQAEQSFEVIDNQSLKGFGMDDSPLSKHNSSDKNNLDQILQNNYKYDSNMSSVYTFKESPDQRQNDEMDFTIPS